MIRISAEHLREVLNYVPETGVFRWLVAPLSNGSIHIGDEAGAFHRGYLEIQIDGTKYQAHRLAWLYVHGEWPKHQIDHKDTIRSNNWIANLREATVSQNAANRKIRKTSRSSVKGVSWNNKARKWAVQVGPAGSNRHKGLFDNFDDAVTAASRAASLFGEFGRPV